MPNRHSCHNDPVTRVPSMTLRVGAAALGGVLALGALSACSGDGPADADEPTTDQASEATTESGTESDPAEGYLPVPVGVTLTEPGTDLALGDAATIAWQPRQDSVVALDVVVERVDETTFKESFDGWVVTKEMRGQTPYFVRARVTNVGSDTVGKLLVPIYALAGGTSLYEPLDFREETFKPCPGGELPKKLRPGASADLCFVYLLPELEPFQAAAFDPVGDAAPVTWVGEITTIEKDKKGEKGKKKRKKGDQGG